VKDELPHAARTHGAKSSERSGGQLARVALDIVGNEDSGPQHRRRGREGRVVASGVYKHFRDKDELIDTPWTHRDRLIENVDAVSRETCDSLERLRPGHRVGPVPGLVHPAGISGT